MGKITIQDQNELADGWRFTVQTPEDTTHTVTLDKEYYQKLTAGKVTPEDVIKESFGFLLTREPASAILSEFNLKDIESYFPEFLHKISNQL